MNNKPPFYVYSFHHTLTRLSFDLIATYGHLSLFPDLKYLEYCELTRAAEEQVRDVPEAESKRKSTCLRDAVEERVVQQFDATWLKLGDRTSEWLLSDYTPSLFGKPSALIDLTS